ESCIVDFDPDLILQLLQSRLCLAKFEFRADLVCLRRSVAKRNRNVQSHRIRRKVFTEGGVKCIAVAAEEWRFSRSAARSGSTTSTAAGSRYTKCIALTGESGAAISAEEVDCRQHRI